VDPETQRISVLVLEAGKYVDQTESGRGGVVNSRFLPEFGVAVSAVFDVS